MEKQIDKRTSFKFLCEVGSNIIPAKNMDDCLYIAKNYGACAVFRLDEFPLPNKYTYVCDLFIDEVLSKGGD